MKFESTESVYEVVNLLNKNNDYESYICYAENNEYLILILKSDNVKKSCCSLFAELYENENSFYIKDIFTCKNNVAVVFNCDRINCNFKLASGNDFSYEAKLKFLYDIISGLCIYNIPVCIMTDMLKNCNVGYKSDHNVGFFFNLKEIENYNEFDNKYYTKVFSDEVLKLFHSEIKNEIGEDISDFCCELKKNNPLNYIELFERYQKIYTSLCEKLKNDGITPKTKGIKFWKIFKKIISIIKTVVTVAILLLALWFLIATLRNNKTRGSGIFKNIGTIDIEEYSEPE